MTDPLPRTDPERPDPERPDPERPDRGRTVSGRTVSGRTVSGRTVLGRTGLDVTRIGLGTAAIGRPGYLTTGRGEALGDDRRPEVLESMAHALLDAAATAGVDYVDCARSYGRAEAFVASWLASHGGATTDGPGPGAAGAPGRPTIGSKWGYTYTAGWAVDADVHEVKEHSLAAYRRQREETAATLGDALDLYQVHSATLDSGVLDDAALLEAMAGDAADTGVAVGLSVSGVGQADTIRRALDVGADLFSCVQATWNPLEPSVGDALAEAHEAGWGVIVKEAVANGRLTAAGSPPPRLLALAAELGVDVDAVAIAAALAQPSVDVVLSGAVTPDQLRSNLAAVDVPVDAVADLHTAPGIAEPAEEYWGARSARPWT